MAGDAQHGDLLNAVGEILAAFGPYVLAVITSGTVSALATALAVGSREKRALRRARGYEETTKAAEALRRYRSTVLKYGLMGTGAADPVRDRELAELGSDVLIACSLIGAGELFDSADTYLATAELFAIHDPGTNALQESEAFSLLMKKVVSSRKSVR
jgi:hypothetical protein